MMYNSTNNPEHTNNCNYQTNCISNYPLIESTPTMIPILYSPPPPQSLSPVEGDDDEMPRRDERFPQWSNQETRDFIEIRAHLEWSFNIVKRNKNLWEMVVNRMREKGYRRTIDQCKCKWKNLINRYKGIQVSNVDNAQQCPFFNELHAVFMSRENSGRVQPESQTMISTKGKNKRIFSSDSQSQEDLLETPGDETETEIDPTPKRRITNRHKVVPPVKQPINNNNNGIISLVRDMMKNFNNQQKWIDLQWKEMMEKREQERDSFEKEWKGVMEKLEHERLAMEQSWRAREEQRRLREESRAEKRDALLTTLMNKLIKDGNA